MQALLSLVTHCKQMAVSSVGISTIVPSVVVVQSVGEIGFRSVHNKDFGLEPLLSVTPMPHSLYFMVAVPVLKVAKSVKAVKVAFFNFSVKKI